MSTWSSGPYRVTSIGASAAAPGGSTPPTVRGDPAAAARWAAESRRLRLAGDLAGADVALAQEMRATAVAPDLVQAADLILSRRPQDADAALRRILAQRPQDPVVLWMLGDVASRLGRNDEAEALLRRTLDLKPDFTSARYAFALVLSWREKIPAALAEADRLLAVDPDDAMYLHLRASALYRLGDDAGAADAYARALKVHPDSALSWLSLGHALKTLGRQAEAVAAYRRALDLSPALGEAWWSLANLKTVTFSDEDVAAIRNALAAPVPDIDRLQLHFALGKALEDRRDFEGSFRAYAEGNAIQRRRSPYDARETTAQARRTRALLTPGFFAARAGQGCPRPDPIFIVGLPRSGSTLIEQILASHSCVEGTQELPYLPMLAARLAGGARRESEGAYPDILAALPPAELRALGEEYLDRARTHRRTDRPYFIDKLPNNWIHVSLIALALPQARIIDMRRHPMACGFSAFKQHFAAGQAFTYDLGDLGRYYADYVELMTHVDAVLPGRIHRVFYERMVADLEGETRRLLDSCGLAFEPACLRFHETARSVRTASSEQVRRPLFRDAVDQWRNYEPWLEPLKIALGPTLDAYLEVEP